MKKYRSLFLAACVTLSLASCGLFDSKSDMKDATLTRKDGSTLATKADGSFTLTRKDGVTVTVNADNSMALVNPALTAATTATGGAAAGTPATPSATGTTVSMNVGSDFTMSRTYSTKQRLDVSSNGALTVTKADGTTTVKYTVDGTAG